VHSDRHERAGYLHLRRHTVSATMPARVHPLATLAAALVAALACACNSAPAGAVTKCQTSTIVPAVPKTDILFVVDDSGSMKAEQDLLAAGFSQFIDQLANLPVKGSFQIGVTTTSVDYPVVDTTSPQGYSLVTRYPSGQSYPQGALVASSGKKILDASSPTLVPDFQANVNVGTSGSGKEQGLRAALLAVTDRIADGANNGFLRPGARLAIIIVSDEDDCSDPATPPAIIYDPSGPDRCHSDADQAKLPAVQTYLDALKQPLAGERRDLIVAELVGVDPVTKQPAPTLACNPTGGYGAYRYTAFAQGVKDQGGQALVADVCQGDFTSTLAAIAGLIATQTVPISEVPADWHLLTVSVHRAAGATVACTVGLDGDPSAAGADVIYTPPREGRSASLTFGRNCTLAQGDDVHVELLCAG
jgi:hypothetical protein